VAAIVTVATAVIVATVARAVRAKTANRSIDHG